jgi:hypothetical protein
VVESLLVTAEVGDDNAGPAVSDRGGGEGEAGLAGPNGVLGCGNEGGRGGLAERQRSTGALPPMGLAQKSL